MMFELLVRWWAIDHVVVNLLCWHQWLWMSERRPSQRPQLDHVQSEAEFGAPKPGAGKCIKMG